MTLAAIILAVSFQAIASQPATRPASRPASQPASQPADERQYQAARSKARSALALEPLRKKYARPLTNKKDLDAASYRQALAARNTDLQIIDDLRALHMLIGCLKVDMDYGRHDAAGAAVENIRKRLPKAMERPEPFYRFNEGRTNAEDIREAQKEAKAKLDSLAKTLPDDLQARLEVPYKDPKTKLDPDKKAPRM